MRRLKGPISCNDAMTGTRERPMLTRAKLYTPSEIVEPGSSGSSQFSLQFSDAHRPDRDCHQEANSDHSRVFKNSPKIAYSFDSERILDLLTQFSP